MINLSKLHSNVREDIEEFYRANKPDPYPFVHITRYEAIDAFLQWNGIIGYTNYIIRAIDEITAAEVK